MQNKKVGIGIAVSVGVILLIAAVFVVDALLEARVDAQFDSVALKMQQQLHQDSADYDDWCSGYSVNYDQKIEVWRSLGLDVGRISTVGARDRTMADALKNAMKEACWGQEKFNISMKETGNGNQYYARVAMQDSADQMDKNMQSLEKVLMLYREYKDI